MRSFKNFGLFLFLLSLRGHAQYFPLSALAHSKHCYFARIQNSRQRGVAWIVSSQKKLYALTPAHVSSKLGESRLYCEQKSYALKLKGESPTYDLAVFEIQQADSQLRAVVDMDDPLHAKEIFAGQRFVDYSTKHEINESFQSRFLLSSGLVTPNLGHEKQLLSFRANAHWLSLNNSYLSPLYGAYFATSAIRPGMSGSALLHNQNLNESRVAGMIVRVETNGFRSLVLPIQDIVRLFPALRQGIDPWRASQPTAPYFHYFTEKNSRYSAVVIPSDGDKILRDACPTSVLLQNAGGSWTDGGGGSWTDGAGSWTDGGGSWTDGGQGKAKVPESKSDVHLTGNAAEVYYWMSQSTCPLEGVKFPSGKVGIAMKNFSIGLRNYNHQRVQSLIDLYPFLLRSAAKAGASFRLEDFSQEVLFMDDNDWRQYCTPHFFGTKTHTRSQQGPAQTFTPFLMAANRKVLNVSVHAQKEGKDFEWGVSCNPGKKILRYRIDFSTPTLANVKVNFQRVGNRWQGQLDFDRCTKTFDIPVTDPWRFVIDDKEISAQFLLNEIQSPDPSLLALRVFRAAPSCLSSEGKQFYIFNFDNVDD